MLDVEEQKNVKKKEEQRKDFPKHWYFSLPIFFEKRNTPMLRCTLSHGELVHSSWLQEKHTQ